MCVKVFERRIRKFGKEDYTDRLSSKLRRTLVTKKKKEFSSKWGGMSVSPYLLHQSTAFYHNVTTYVTPHFEHHHFEHHPYPKR